MKLEVFDDSGLAARKAAAYIAADARSVMAASGRYALAVSGGHTPWIMLRALVDEDISWAHVHIYQVDERVAPEGHTDRNLTHLRESFLQHVALPPENVHTMPVESSDLEAAANEYALALQAIAGSPPVFDLVHLGLGPDGHTASLVPCDQVLDIFNRDVAITSVYQGRRRMTLTYPALNRAKRILWVVTGGDKTEMLSRLLHGDQSIPAGYVRQEHALLIADRPAAGGLTVELKAGGRS